MVEHSMPHHHESKFRWLEENRIVFKWKVKAFRYEAKTFAADWLSGHRRSSTGSKKHQFIISALEKSGPFFSTSS
jgi:hypothetical protein